MNLDSKFVKSVLTFYDEMVGNGISLLYLGEFNQQITKMFSSMTEENMKKQNTERTLKKRLYHVMVETLQNMSKHTETTEAPSVASGLFLIGKRDTKYYVITANKIEKDKVMDLKEDLDVINSSTPEQLRAMYMAQIKGGTLSAKGGAGLGLIDMARKTGQKYHYQFIHLDDLHDLFIMKIEVNMPQPTPVEPTEVESTENQQLNQAPVAEATPAEAPQVAPAPVAQVVPPPSAPTNEQQPTNQ